MVRCVCNSRYEGCSHDDPCGREVPYNYVGPWCKDCNPRRLDHLTRRFQELQANG